MANALLVSIASVLNLTESFFEHRTNRHQSALRALNYYRIVDSTNEECHDDEQCNIVRCSEHSDWGTLTLLSQDHSGGLQVLVKREGGGGGRGAGGGSEHTWMDVVTDWYDLVVNSGDMLMRWTEDLFVSTRHRVVMTPRQAAHNRRHSMAFFHLVNPDTIVESLLPSNNHKYVPIQAWHYLETKHRSTQSYGQ